MYVEILMLFNQNCDDGIQNPGWTKSIVNADWDKYCRNKKCRFLGGHFLHELKTIFRRSQNSGIVKFRDVEMMLECHSLFCYHTGWKSTSNTTPIQLINCRQNGFLISLNLLTFLIKSALFWRWMRMDIIIYDLCNWYALHKYTMCDGLEDVFYCSNCYWCWNEIFHSCGMTNFIYGSESIPPTPQ